MRAIHLFIKICWTSALIAGGLLLALYPLGEIYQSLADFLAGIEYPDWARPAAGSVAALIALLAFVPLWPRGRSGRTVTFEGAQGQVTVELDPAEAMLQRVVSKLKEVKSIALRVYPKGESGLKIVASAVLNKDAESDAREVTARVNSYILAHARKLTGLRDIELKIKIRKFVINLRTLNTEPLLLEDRTSGGAGPRGNAT